MFGLSLADLDRLERSFIATRDPDLGIAASDQILTLEKELGHLRASVGEPLSEQLERAIDRRVSGVDEGDQTGGAAGGGEVRMGRQRCRRAMAW